MATISLKNLKRSVIICFGALILVLVGATVMEKLNGTEWAHENIYGARWFAGLWAVSAIASFAYVFACKLWRKPAAFLLHCAFGVILSGALVTYIYGQKGYMHIRQGETSASYIAEDEVTQRQLPFELKLILFDIEYHPDSNDPADYISFMKSGEQISQVSMNKILRKDGYRFYQYDYDRDEQGTILLVSHDPWGIGVTYTGYLLLAVAMLWLLFLRIGWRWLLGVMIPTAGVWFYISQINPMTPILRTPMLAAHVSVIMVSYALLLFFMITGIAGLCNAKACERFYRWNSRLLYPALFLLAAGIFIGAVWANISWGRYWGWDAKETWALITLLVYSVPLHRISLPGFLNPHKFHLYCVIAFIAVLMTFFGVSYLLGGIHSYV